MLFKSKGEIVGYADIQGAVSAARKDVDIVEHDGSLESALNSSHGRVRYPTRRATISVVPAEEPGPILRVLSIGHGVWVPAFAGTTESGGL
jgi:hypothetical protein